MNTKDFQIFLEEAQRRITSKESESGCVYMDALKTKFPDIYSQLPDELNTSVYREHIPLLFNYLLDYGH